LSGSYTESTSRDNFKDERAVNDASQTRAEPTHLTIDEEESTDLNILDWPDDDQHHSQAGETRQENHSSDREDYSSLAFTSAPPLELTSEEVSEMCLAICNPRTMAGRMALAYVERGEHSLESIADALCSELRKPEGFADRCLERLPQALEELRLDPVGGAS
jgi:hypothetical protein